ncbi:hypothetical protein DFP73DRAFT_634625 [Morchella snyderi]|nr:hypothetical protein DFP73DRAFT_634625 [Morchella snyderi]
MSLFSFGSTPPNQHPSSASDQGGNFPPRSNYDFHTTAPSASLPTDVAALHSIINALQAQLQATTAVNTHLATSVARLQAEQATPASFTPTNTVPTTPVSTTPTPTFYPGAPAHASCSPPTQLPNTVYGRGAGSPQIFKQITKTNWHGRLGRAHMADVDALPTAALMELDGLVRRKLRGLFPPGAACTYSLNADETFGGLAALGLRLENRDRYMCQIFADGSLLKDSTSKRARNLAEYYYANEKYAHNEYLRGFLIETLVELGRYRGLFDDEGSLREE